MLRAPVIPPGLWRPPAERSVSSSTGGPKGRSGSQRRKDRGRRHPDQSAELVEVVDGLPWRRSVRRGWLARWH